jgi:hypothetical protein
VIRMDEPTVSHSMLLCVCLERVGSIQRRLPTFDRKLLCALWLLFLSQTAVPGAKSNWPRRDKKQTPFSTAHAARRSQFPTTSARRTTERERELFSFSANSVSIVIGRCALCPLLSEWG